MSTPVIPAVTAPESASGNEVQEVSLQERLNAATEEEYKTWERTGDIPPVKPKSEATPPKIEAPAAAKDEKLETTSSAVPGETIPPKTETAAAPEAARPPLKKRDVDGRVAQLLKERKEQDEKWAARFDALEKKLAPPAEASVKPGPQPAADDKEIKASDPEPELGGVNSKTGKPYQTVAEWQKEHTAWLRAGILAEVNGTLSKSEQQRAQVEQRQVLDQGLNEKFKAGRDKYPDFDKVACSPDLFLPFGSAADVFIRNSENAHEIAYYLGQHPDILTRFYRDPTGKNGMTGVYENAIAPALQMMELARIEAKLTGSPAATVTSPAAIVPSAAPQKQLPPPPTVLSARSNAGTDPVEEALHKKSFADYEKAANASERKARRG
jgi:hypothetical protein